MNKVLKSIFWILGVILVVFLILSFLWYQQIKPNKNEEEKTRLQAQEYLKENFKGKNYKVYDILNDNMGNYGYFDYAAKVTNPSGSIDFLVYYNKETHQMEDSYTIGKKETYIRNEVKPKITTYAKKLLGDKIDVSAEYEYSTGKPLIIIRVHRKPHSTDEHNFYNTVNYLQNELKVQHADVNMFYPDENIDEVLNKNY